MPLLRDSNIWRIDLMKPAEPASLLISSTRADFNPEFSPDGKRIAFVSTRSGHHEIWVCDREGRNLIQLTSFGGPHAGSPRWSPDGRMVAFDGRPMRSSDADIYVTKVDGDLSRRLTTGTSEDVVPCWSEDGRWIYFGSTRSGDWQLWKIRAEGGNALPVTNKGGFVIVAVKNGFIYYIKNMIAAIWRMPEEGGKEEVVLDTSELHYSRYSAVVDQGIYSLDLSAGNPRTINFMNLATRRADRVAALNGQPLVWEPGITVSADGRWMLYAQVDQDARDIMLVENFR